MQSSKLGLQPLGPERDQSDQATPTRSGTRIHRLWTTNAQRQVRRRH